MNRIEASSLGAVVMAGAAALSLGWGTSASAQTVLSSSDPGVLALGQPICSENCVPCHCAKLKGQPNWWSLNQDSQLPAPPHYGTNQTWHHNGETLFRLSKYGTGALIGNPDYVSNMPIYRGVLADDVIIAALSYIKSTFPQEIRKTHDETENRQ